MNREEFLKEFNKKLKKGGPFDFLLFIKENFYFLFENADLLLEIEREIEKFDSNFKTNDPVFKLLKARIFSLKHRDDLIEEEFKNFDFNDIPEEYKDYYIYTVALVYFNRKKYNLAIKMIESGLEISESKKRRLRNFMEYRLKNLKGIIYFEKDDYENALNSFKEALNSAEKVKISKVGYRGILESIGKVYMMRGEFLKAIEIFEKILQDFEEKSLDYRILRKIAVCYLNLGNIRKSYEYIERGIKNFKKYKGAEFYYVFFCMTFCDILEAQGKMKKAREFVKTMKELSLKYSYQNVDSHVKLSEIKYLIADKKIKKALEILSQPFDKKRGSLLAEFLFYKAIAFIYLSELKKSKWYFEEALNNVPPDSYLKKVIWDTYLMFLSQVDRNVNRKRKGILERVLKRQNFDPFYINIIRKYGRLI